MMGQTFGSLFSVHHYLSGETAPAGWYRDLETGNQIHLKNEASLPVGPDGLPTFYVCVEFSMQSVGSGKLLASWLP